MRYEQLAVTAALVTEQSENKTEPSYLCEDVEMRFFSIQVALGGSSLG